MSTKLSLGKLLIMQDLLTEAQLETALHLQQQQGIKLGAAILSLGFVDENTLLTVIAKQLNIDFIDLKQFDLDHSCINRLPESYARRFRTIVLAEEPAGYLIGMADPQDIVALSEVERILKASAKIAIVSESVLMSMIDKLYRQTQAISSVAEELSEIIAENTIDIDTLHEDDFANDELPVVKLLQHLFTDAIQIKASDIHIEPAETDLRIRLRVDGLLQEQRVKNINIVAALTQRLKIMAGLSIAEKRLPQDGRFQINVKQQKIDVRISTLPTQYGESVVMRLLRQDTGILNLDEIEMPEAILKSFRHAIHRTTGVILVTGPTGSGKTTTLYSALQELNSPQNKIITVEDPVEYRLERINQVQVNAKIDLNFARILRAILRQDPDIILIGEIRDTETAGIALRSAMTGHLVLATLHTNNTKSSVTRLLDMGIESYLVAAAVRAVLAQRLLRRICKNCSEDYILSAAEQNWVMSVLGKIEQVNFKKGRGCNFCSKTGYSSRIAVYEWLEMTPALMEALQKNDTLLFNQRVDQDPNLRSLALNGLDVAMRGMTTVEEVMRVASEV